MSDSTQNRITVIDPYGRFGSIPSSEASDAVANGGFRIPSNEEVQNYQLKQQYGTGLVNPAIAFAEGLASGATFGLSRAVERMAGVSPEAMSARERFNPLASTAGEVTGVVGSLLVPGMAPGKGAISGLKAIEAGKVFTPVQAIAKAGRAITKAVTPTAEKAAGALINPETSPIIHRIVSSAAATGLGSAIEGSAYGLGQSVNEAALGDPSLNAERVMANIGYGALWGGALGAGIEGAISPFIKNPSQSAVEKIGIDAEREIPAIAQAHFDSTNSFENALRASGMPEAQKQSLLGGLTSLKPNIKEIDGAAERLGVQTFPGQRSNSQFVQKQYGMVTQSPSPFGVAEAQKIQESSAKISSLVDNSLGSGVAATDFDFGNEIKKAFTKEIETKADPIQQIYQNHLDPYFKVIPVSDSATKKVSRSILKIEDFVNAEGKPLSTGSPGYQLAKRVSDELPNVKTLDDLKRFRTIIRNDVKGHPDLWHVHSSIEEKLGSLEEATIGRFAKETIQDPIEQGNVSSLLDLHKTAKSEWAKLSDNLSDIGELAGRRGKIYGPQHLISVLDNGISAERLGKNVLRIAKSDSAKLDLIKEKFPKIFEQIQSQVKSQIKELSFEDGELNLNKALKNINKLSPEAKKAIFNPQELQIIQDAKTWRDAWPAKFGPSGTPEGIQYLDFFKNPVSYLGTTGRDLAILSSIKHVGGYSGDAAKTAGLAFIERASQSVIGNISSASKKIFEVAPHAAVAIPSILEDKIKEKKKTKNTMDDIKDHVSSIDKLLDKVDKTTQNLYPIAPNHAGTIQQKMTSAAAFLHSKAPQKPEMGLAEAEYKTSDYELSEFKKYFDIVDDPTKALEQVRLGTITTQTIETLNSVYPSLYDEMKSAVLEKFMEHKAQKTIIPYRTKLALSIFLGTDLIASLNQQSIVTNQAILSRSAMQKDMMEQAQMGGTKSKAMAKLGESNRMKTPMQATNERNKV